MIDIIDFYSRFNSLSSPFAFELPWFLRVVLLLSMFYCCDDTACEEKVTLK